jgi:hypothetical protein
MLFRIAIAVLVAVPGMALVVLAKPVFRTEAALFFGLFIGVMLPVIWLIASRPRSYFVRHD